MIQNSGYPWVGELTVNGHEGALWCDENFLSVNLYGVTEIYTYVQIQQTLQFI